MEIDLNKSIKYFTVLMKLCVCVFQKFCKVRISNMNFNRISNKSSIVSNRKSDRKSPEKKLSTNKVVLIK